MRRMGGCCRPTKVSHEQGWHRFVDFRLGCAFGFERRRVLEEVEALRAGIVRSGIGGWLGGRWRMDGEV